MPGTRKVTTLCGDRTCTGRELPHPGHTGRRVQQVSGQCPQSRPPYLLRRLLLDALTYAGHIENLGTAFLSPKLTFVHGNILDAELVDDLMAKHAAVVHFAAESHVDRSFFAAAAFLETNVRGTQTLLDAAMRHEACKFVHVSTDEVYGPLLEGTATEDFPLRPSVPYAASKAASDLIALSYWQTYGVPVCVTRSSNNYGPYQHPEKIIPLFVTRLLRGQPVTLHGRGEHVRNWLHVEDNCAGIEAVLRGGRRARSTTSAAARTSPGGSSPSTCCASAAPDGRR